MRVPKKITPDRIKDSIVEFRYLSKFPSEIALGMFFNCLDDSYTYTNRPVQKPTSKGNVIQAHLNVNFALNQIQPLGQALFFNEKIKIQFLNNSIVFNCLNEYIGWSEYSIEIEKALAQLFKANVIERVVRIGMRYMTEYQNQDLNDCVNFKFTFGMPNLKAENFTFKAEYKLSDYKIILRLDNKQLVPVPGNLSAVTSLIDIDVIAEGLESNSVESLLMTLESVHSKEKEVFFTLLKEEFLKNLNPTY